MTRHLAIDWLILTVWKASDITININVHNFKSELNIVSTAVLDIVVGIVAAMHTVMSFIYLFIY